MENVSSRVGIVTGLVTGRPRNRGSILGTGKRCVSSPENPDRLWNPLTQPNI